MVEEFKRWVVGKSGPFLLVCDLGEKLLWVFRKLSLASPAAYSHGNCRSCVRIIITATKRALAISGLGDFGKKSGRVFFKFGHTPTAAETNLDLDRGAAIGSFPFHWAGLVHWSGEGRHQR